MGELYDRAFRSQALRDAWAVVYANDRADGVLSAGVSRFAADADNRLSELCETMATFNFHPLPLSVVEIPKQDGGTRELQIPPVRDRVVERAAAAVLTDIIDPLLGPSSFAYRPGLGVADAVQAVARLRDEGHSWVLRTDVDDCFPTVELGRLRRILDAIVPDSELRGLLDVLLDRKVTGRGGTRAGRGLAQGSPLSPMLANLTLQHLDDRLCRSGFPTVRYADDVAVLSRTTEEAWEAARVATAALEEIGMSLGSDKTAVMSFEEGFVFLGEEFGPRYPPALDGDRIIDPPRRALYLGRQGSRARIADGRLIVESPDDEELLNVATGQVERVLCFGAVGVSAGLRSWALNSGVDIAFMSRRGTYLGELRPANAAGRIRRLRAQLSASEDPDRCLPFGGLVVDAKLRKQAVLLTRLVRRESDDRVGAAAAYIRQLTSILAEADDRDGLMGVEGAAARAYFEALGLLVPDEVRFAGRSRQPPLDLVNAALSYGYALLLSEAVSAAVSAGLEPAVGLLHADHDDRPSLALDLMEEFRPLVVDQVVMTAVRRRELRAEHARVEDGRPGVLLTKAGREVVIAGYERRMLQMTRGALPGFSGSLRRHLYRQAQRLAMLIEHGEPAWSGLSWR